MQLYRECVSQSRTCVLARAIYSNVPEYIGFLFYNYLWVRQIENKVYNNLSRLKSIKESTKNETENEQIEVDALFSLHCLVFWLHEAEKVDKT